MKKFKSLRQAFGIDKYGLIDFPEKISNIRISRILYGNEMGCSYCFPHGCETINSKEIKFQRNWKKYRKTQWKLKSKCCKAEFLRGGSNTGSNPVPGIGMA